jgi:hypothetical protein|tara:strand:+ start:36 stop:620 length:585 start_codon:yes stop_codon:yes gene_type:complete
MDNQLNSGNLDTLKQGQTILINGRKIKGDKISLEFGEIIPSKGKKQTQSIIGELNFDDDKFTNSSVRRCWISGTVEGINKTLGIKLDTQSEWYMSERGEMVDLDIINPVHSDGTRVRILITETTEPSQYQTDNIDTTCLRKGKDGDYITHQGSNMWSNTTIVKTDEDVVEHTFLDRDSVSQLTSVVDEELVSMM